MSSLDARTVPADPTSTERLAASGLEYRVVDLGDEATATAYQQAVARGFLGPHPSPEITAASLDTFRSRRNIGVYEPGAGAQDFPVATTNAWVTSLTVPGGAEVPMWAVSAVTVAATHRRRGIARALLEGELRAAAGAGVAVAGLTVTEATIYGRYGFGPAVPMARFAVDTRRAGWAGADGTGRLEFVDRETLSTSLGDVHERARRTTAGSIPGWKGRWDGHAGVAPFPDRDRVRGVRYLDEHGEVRGALAYLLSEKGDSFRFSLDVRLLVGETVEARTALWRFVLQHDLVDQVTADLRPVDDPLPWLVADHRGVEQTVHDHGWLRILDVPGALAARRYSAPLDVVIRVSDPLGFAEGTWRLHVDEAGSGVVQPAPSEDADIALDVATLSSLYAGGVRATSLHGAGRITADAAVVLDLDRALAAYPAPALDIWY